MFDFRIPKDSGVLKAMAVYLQEQALAVSREPLCAHCDCRAAADATIPLGHIVTVAEAMSDKGAEVSAQADYELAADTSPDSETTTEAATAFGTAPPPPADETPQELGTVEAPAVGVETADGIPWDARIHSSSKGKLAKAPFGWKLKRGVDKDLVPVVEAELWAAMAVPATVADSIPPEATQAFRTASTEATAPPPPAEAVIPGSDTTTFPQFMGMVTASQFPADVVTSAVQKVGLASTVLLATRPDLIPAVVSELYP